MFSALRIKYRTSLSDWEVCKCYGVELLQENLNHARNPYVYAPHKASQVTYARSTWGSCMTLDATNCADSCEKLAQLTSFEDLGTRDFLAYVSLSRSSRIVQTRNRYAIQSFHRFCNQCPLMCNLEACL
jgi:hypothetical protein